MSSLPKLSDIDSEMANLTVRDRLDWPYLLNYGILTIWMSRRKEVVSTEETAETIRLLESVIPDVYKDDIYRKEITEFTITKVIDIRPKYGGTRLSLDACKRMGIPIEEKVETIDNGKHLQAIMNMLQRIGAVAQKDKVEKFDGTHFSLDEDEGDKDEQPEKNVGVELDLPNKP